MKSLASPAALLLGGLVAASAQAQSNASTTVVVTATRSAQTVDDALASVTVIARDEIERKQFTSVTEVLRSVPGMLLTNNGGRGKTSSFYLRGTNSDQVLVLIDGVKVGSATAGSTAFEHLALDQVERIEIVRGPRSSLYGSEAIGGVIQIFTRRGAEGFKPRFSAEAGSHDTRQLSAGVSGGTGAAWYNLSLSDLTSDGINATRPSAWGYNPDKDDYQQQAFALSGGYRFSERAELSLNFSRSEAENAYDGGGSFNDYVSHVDLETLGTTLRLTPSDNWGLNLTLGRSRDESAEYGDDSYSSHIDTERDTVSVVSEHYLGNLNQFTWGVDHQQDEVDSSTAYAETSRDNTGVFGLYQLYFGRQDLAFSLRHDDNEQFGGHNTGSLAWGLELPQDLRLTASYGTAFKAPTFNDLYWPDQGWYKGNPNLVPEESESLELGLNGEHAGVRWSASLYQTDIENLIAYDSSLSSPNNVSEARIRGLELIASTRLAQWDLSTSLDLLDPKNRANDSVLNRRARKILNLSADRDFGRYSLGGSLQAVGKRPDGSAQLGGYTKLDLRAGYTLAPDWALKTRVENLLDESYQTANNYNQDGRTLWLSLHYAP